MKKLLISVIFLSALILISSSLSAKHNAGTNDSYFLIKGGLDVMGTLDNDIEEEGDAENGFTFAAEYIVKNSDQLGFGGGLIYQFPRGVDESESVWADTKYSFIPVYGLLRIFFKSENMNPYATIHLGYNFIRATDLPGDVETDGGLYWGIGGGILFSNNFLVEILYSVNNGVLSSDYYDIEADAEYSKVTISGGYAF